MKTKKILSLVVVLTLVLSFFAMGTVQAAEDEFAILRTLGINTDFSDDTTPITRYQLAEIALELTGIAPDADGEPAYPDVPVKHKLFPVINAVTKNGLMGGLMDGSFGADTYASIMDGGRVLLSELGYTSFAVQAGWTDAQYSSKVQSLGLTSGVDSSKGLTYNAIGRMMVNMLTTKVMEIVAVTSDGIQYAESDKTYAESKYGYVIKTGIFQANGSASIAGYSAVRMNEAVLDGAIYKTNALDYTRFVGYPVKVILTSEIDGEIIHVEKYTGYEELVIPAENIDSYSNYTYRYHDENEKVETAVFAPNARVIVNGQNMSSYNESYFVPDHGEVTLVDTDGNEVFDLVDIEYMFYYKVGGTTATAISDSWTGDRIDIEDLDAFVYKEGVGTDIMQIEAGAYAEISAGAIKFEEIGGNVIVKPDLQNTEVIAINAIDAKTVSGSISTKTVDSIGIDGVMYKLNPYYYDLIKSGYVDPVALGSTATLVLNEKGQVIDVKDIVSSYANSEVPKSYGYMIGCVAARGETGQAIIKIIDITTLEEKSLFTAEECKYNGKKFEFNKHVKVDATTNTGFYLPDGNFKHQLIRFATNDAGEVTELYLAVDRAHEKIVKHIIPVNAADYKVSTSDDYYVDAPNPDYIADYDGYDSNNFTLDKSGFIFGRGLVGALYELQPSTIQIKIEVDSGDYNTYANVKDPKYWSVSTGKTIKDNNLISQSYGNMNNWGYVALYDASEEYCPSVAIKYRKTAAASADAYIPGVDFGDSYFRPDSRYHYVTGVDWIYDEAEGEEKLQITAVKATQDSIETVTLLPAGKITESSRMARRDPAIYDFELDEATYVMDNYGTIRDVNPNDYLLNGSELPTRRWDEIEVGDMLECRFDTMGYVSGFRIMVENEIIEDLDNIVYGRVTSNYWYDEAALISVNLGYVLQSYGVNGFLMNIGGPNGPNYGLRKIGQLNPVPGGNNSIKGAAMIIHTKSKTCESATLSDVKVGDTVLVRRNTDVPVELFILRP